MFLVLDGVVLGSVGPIYDQIVFKRAGGFEKACRKGTRNTRLRVKRDGNPQAKKAKGGFV